MISRRTDLTLALVLAHQQGEGLAHLTKSRPKSFVPFGGNYRVIDFTLSNCVNSGIRRIAVLTQYKSVYLNNYLTDTWHLFKSEFGEYIRYLPVSQRTESNCYYGTADAIYQNIDVIKNMNPEFLLIVPGSHVYKMDYGPLLAYHIGNNADVTIACTEMAEGMPITYGAFATDEENRIRSIRFDTDSFAYESKQNALLRSMGIYVFNKKFLFEQLTRDADTSNSRHDLETDIIPYCVKRYRAFAYQFIDVQRGRCAYWNELASLDEFVTSNLEVVSTTPSLNLYDASWPIWTSIKHLASSRFLLDEDGCRGTAVESMVCDGCLIYGSLIRRSLLFPNVRVSLYTKISDCVILPGVKVGPRSHISRAVIDSGCEIPEGTVIGADPEEDALRFHVAHNGWVLVSADMLGQTLDLNFI